MQIKYLAGLIIGIMILAAAVPSYAGHAVILSDEELDEVSAGGIPEVFWDVLPISTSDAGTYIDSLTDIASGYFDLNNGTTVFTLGDHAQQNVQALANINAVNSAVAYLLNITIVNGPNFGDITQINEAVVSKITNVTF